MKLNNLSIVTLLLLWCIFVVNCVKIKAKRLLYYLNIAFLSFCAYHSDLIPSRGTEFKKVCFTGVINIWANKMNLTLNHKGIFTMTITFTCM